VIIGRVGALSNSTYADLCSAQTVGYAVAGDRHLPRDSSLEGGYDIAVSPESLDH